MRVGIAGTGKMGSAIGLRLHSLGHQVTVWNRTRAKAQPMLDAGLAWADTPKALAATCDLVITLLTNEQALDDVYFSAEGLLAAPAQGKLFLEMSTVSPAKQEAMGARATALGAAYLECPVGGSVGPAKEGKLMAFVGGAAADLERARPLLEQMCKRIEHVGAHGAGAMMKLAVNLPLMVYWQTLGEALSMVAPLGLDPKRVVDILTESSGGPNMLKVRGGQIGQALAGEQTGVISVDIATMRKDMRTMLAQGQANKRQLPLTEMALKNFDAAAANGLDAADCTQLPVWWLAKGGRA